MSLLRIQQEVEAYLQKRILEILGGRPEEAVRYTILGSDINRIRHIFYYLRMNRTPVRVDYQLESYTATVVDVEDAQATLNVPGFEETPFRRIKLRFSMMNTFYQFEVILSRVEGEEVSFQLPTNLQSATRRKYPRHTLQRTYILFNTVYRPIFGTRGIGQIVEDKNKYLIEELRKDFPDLSLMLRIISDDLIGIAGDYELQFYKPDRKLSLMETTIIDEDKTLYIASTENIDCYTGKPESSMLVAYNREFNRLARESSKAEAMKFFEELQKSEMRRHVYSYVCAPLHLFGRVIGHIYIETNLLYQKRIYVEDAVRVAILADLLSYGMTKTVIARTYFTKPIAEIMNLSMAGVLFRIPSSTVYDYLIDHDLLKLKIPLTSEYLSFHAEITRMFSDENRYHLALRFVDGAEDDYRKLEQFLYNDTRAHLRGKSRGPAGPLTELHE
jgi:hypothetical protein